MLKTCRTVLAAALVLTSSAAMAKPSEIQALPADYQTVGKTSFSFLFWDFFDAELRSRSGAFDWNQSLALTLTYKTDFSADELTDSTMESMAKVTPWSEPRLSAFRNDVASCMSNVKRGDRFTAYSPSPDEVVLYLNGREHCRWQQPGLREAYLGIWLSEQSGFPKETAQLTGRQQ